VVYISMVCRLSSVTLVRRSQAVEIFGNISTALGAGCVLEKKPLNGCMFVFNLSNTNCLSNSNNRQISFFFHVHMCTGMSCT